MGTEIAKKALAATALAASIASANAQPEPVSEIATEHEVSKTVDQFLNEIDYTELNNYTPSPFAIKYINFVKLVNAGNDDVQDSPALHYKMIDELQGKATHIANLCSRGLAKTTMFGEMLVLYLAIFREIPDFGSVDVMMYISDSMENGAKSFRENVEARYNNSQFLRTYLPQVKFTDTELVFTNTEGKKFWCKLFGAKTGVRGFKRNGSRPQLAVLDDLVSDSDANSDLILSRIKDIVYSGIDNAMNSRYKVVFNGTPFNKNDPLYEAIESGGWVSNVYPICNEFPCSREEFVSAWGDRYDYDFILGKYNLAVKTGKLKSFKQELMLRIASTEDRMVHDDDLRWYKSYELLAEKQKYNFVITTDFATSKDKKADYTVICVWALDVNQNRYLVDGRIGRQLMNKTFDDLFYLVAKYQPQQVGIETSGQQGAFISLIREQMIKRNIYFTIAKGKSSSGSTAKEGIAAKGTKMDRFTLSVPSFKENKFYLPEDLKTTKLVQELLDEVSFVTIDGIKSKHDDVLDCISQLDQMYLFYPDKYQSTLSKQESQENNQNVYFNGSTGNSDIDESSYSHYLA